MSDITTKTISLESAKLYRVKTVLADLLVALVPSFLNPVEVRAGNKRLGWASLYLEPHGRDMGLLRLGADLVFSYATPERLSIEAGERLYANLEGVFTLDVDPFEVIGTITTVPNAKRDSITDIQVLGIEIGREPAFEGQPYLGEPVL